MTHKHIKHFKVLPLRFSSNSSAYHEIFIKEHSHRKKSEDKPADRTLFVLNIPPYATEESIKNVFNKISEVENVIFEYKTDKKIGFKTCFIVFVKATGILKAMKLTNLEPLSTEEKPVLCGLKKWVKEYNCSIYDPKELQLSVNKIMKKYDLQMELIKKKEQQDMIPDDEGWTVVTKQGRNPGFARKKSVENKIKEKIQAGKKKKQLKNFYTFQIRQSKMQHLASLRKKFEEDKKKIDALKQARKFKPY